jgi:hypothetical protein
MRTRLALGIGAWAALAGAAGAQADPKNPDVATVKEWGITLQRPKKKEDWQFKTTDGRVRSAQLIVAHRVEPVSVEIVVQPPRNDGSFEPKSIAEEEWKVQSTNSDYTDSKKKRDVADGTLPGKGAGGARAWFLDMAMKYKDTGKPFEWRMWCFVSRENRHLYKVNVIGDEGVYEKNKKEIDYIISTIKLFKVPKK